MYTTTRKSDNKDKRIYIIGVWIFIIGISLMSYQFVDEKITIAYDMMNAKLYDNVFEEEQEEQLEVEQPTVVEEEQQEIIETPEEYYIGYLEINKIGLKRGFVDINSKANDVSNNIEIVKASDYPDVKNGNFIIAGHSGNNYNAFFNDLYLLETGDVAYVYYNNVKYTYEINRIYYQDKTGKIAIYRDEEKTTLTLVTCTNDNNSTQTVYIAYLIEQEEY